ncbi:MAG: SRPBCC family protein [Acidimicrobiia bacterium]|jgi:carbon monoxide dehydrogenase subunit G
MADGKVEVHIARPPEEVWALVADFGGLDAWMPGVESCELDGDVRTLQAMGTTLKERLVAQDDEARTQSYSIIDGPMPVEHHLATISVEPDGDGTRFTWSYEVRPDEMAGVFGGIYEGSAKAFKDTLEA